MIIINIQMENDILVENGLGKLLFKNCFKAINPG